MTARGSSLAVALGGILVAMAANPASAQAPGEAAYRRDIAEWREKREARMRSDDGWLTVAGLHWLAPGANSVGSAARSAVALPAHSSPAVAGVLHVDRDDGDGKVVRLEIATGVTATVAGKPVASLAILRPDTPGPPDVVSLGALRFFVIERGGRLAVRVRDLRSPARAAFRGLRWFPVREEFRVSARFEPHAAPRRVAVPTVLGTTDDMASPGMLSFTLAGRDVRLEPVLETPDARELFLIFKDETSGRGTYGAGRFLHADLPGPDGRVWLDFNRAYTPPCAFTRFATCPLPPRGNRLPVRIEAGERDPGHH